MVPEAARRENGDRAAAPAPPVCELVWPVRLPEGGRLALAAVVKRTYSFTPGRVRLADEQIPLVLDPEIEIGAGGECRALLDDTDRAAPKPATDVVVSGHAWGRGARQVQVAVAVGQSARVLSAMGERRVELRRDGTPRFSEPAPFERVALRYENAYGGYDAVAQEELAPLPRAVRKSGRRMTGIFAYPRNPVGAGYFIDLDRDRADGALLPAIEDPADALSPERFFVPRPQAWIDAPIPGSLGFVHHAFYPRIARCVGPRLPHDPPARPIREAELGDGDDLPGDRPLPLGTVHPRAFQGASPGLARERLRGDEAVILRGLHPELPEIRFALPGEIPRLTVHAPDVPAFTPRPVLQTVRLLPDRGLVALTWCGAIPLVALMDEAYLRDTRLTVDWH